MHCHLKVKYIYHLILPLYFKHNGMSSPKIISLFYNPKFITAYKKTPRIRTPEHHVPPSLYPARSC